MRRDDSVSMLKSIRGSEVQAKKRLSGFIMFVVFFFALSGINFSLAQDSSLTISKVSLQVEGQADGEDIQELIPIREGEPFSLVRITESIRQLYKTGLFSDIQILREGEQDIHLTYRLVRRYFTRKIYFLGDKDISRKKLHDAINSVREDSPFSDGKLSNAVDELNEFLRKEGYFYPEIKAFTKEDLQTSSVDVFFELGSLKRFVVKDITFSGQFIFPESELRGEIKTKKGKYYVPSVLEEDIERLKRIYNERDYNRVEINIEDIDYKDMDVFITIEIIPHEQLEIKVRGAKVPLTLLEPIWEERIFEEWGLSEGEAKIINYLRKKGYLFASVTSRIEKSQNRLLVFYDVTPGAEYKIQDITFEGLDYFTSENLKKELGIQGRIPLLSWVTGEKLFALPLEIKTLYQSHGFPQTRIDLNFLKEKNQVEAIYYIEEGSQEKIESLVFQGVQLFDAATLLAQITSKPGGAFFLPTIQKDVERLENFYRDQGVRGTEIRPIIENVAENLYSVLLDIQEGEKVTIEKIIITGNQVTKRSTIQRELRIKEGEYARYGLILETKRRLEKLGIFTEIKLEEIPLSPGKENLLISLREGDRNYVSLGVGLETKNEPQTFAVWDNPIRPRGTAELIRGNIFGLAAQISLVGQLSIKEKRGVFSWEQPNLFGIPVQTYLNAWLEEEERKSFSFDRRGVSLTSVKDFSETKFFFTTLRYTRTTIFDLQVSESEIDRQFIPYSTTSISGSFIWDRRDDPFNPERGSFFSFVLEWAPPLFGSESDFLKNFIKYQHYFVLLPRLKFTSILRIGLGRGLMPIPERFFAGGSNSFRGERFDELGPKDPDSENPVGGKALFLLNFELTFPLLSSIRNLNGVIFYDTGNVYSKRRDFSLSSFRDAVGFGLRYKTPLGPIRFELGWNLDAPEGEKKVIAFITIGNVF